MADQPSPRRRFQFMVIRGLRLAKQVVSSNIVAGLKRWRFQFSLRTLMIVVTLLAIPCGYVGWQAKIVDERNAMITDLRNTEKVVFGLAEPGDNDQPPWILRILGDQGIRYIGLPITTTTTKEYRRRVRELFPEAECIGSFIIRPDNGWIVLTDFPEELSKPGRATRTAHSIYPLLPTGDGRPP